MKYALLIAYDESTDAAMSQEEGEAQMAEYFAFQEGAGSAILDGARLHPTANATTVRVQDGEALASDGPFAETKEQIAGFYMVEAKDLDEAIDIASKIPHARKGSIEVRPVWEM
jgi:hypothetical protein